MRVDLALYGLRLFPSRSAAQAAIESGAVRLNGRPVKPSHTIQPGDRIGITTPRGDERSIEIVALPRKGLSKAVAAECWREAPIGD